jgi:hypothetical protein
MPVAVLTRRMLPVLGCRSTVQKLLAGSMQPKPRLHSCAPAPMPSNELHAALPTKAVMLRPLGGTRLTMRESTT